MKLLVMKLASLFTCIAGIALVAHLMGSLPKGEIHKAYVHFAPPQVKENVPFNGLLIGAGVCLAVFGLYGFLPKLPSKKKCRTVAFTGDHGDVVVQLDMVESTLTRVLGNMPEIKKINVRVEADPKTNKAKIFADCVLNDRPEIPARQAADAVNEYLADAAGNILGVEDIQSVKLNIVGVEVNAKASSQYLESEHIARVKALEAKVLPPAPGLIAGAAALPDQTIAAMPIVPSQAVAPFVEIPTGEPVEDTANLNAQGFRASENTDPAHLTPFESGPDHDETKDDN